MEQTSWHHPLRGFASTEEEALPLATGYQGPFHARRRDEATGYREAYYAYHLGREVQQHHQRLFEKQHLDFARNERLW